MLTRLLAQGDQVSAAGDVVNVRLTVTREGGFVAVWTASSARPFNGTLRLNLNLGNSRLGGNLVSLSQDFDGVSNKTELVYAGSHPALVNWQENDVIVSAGESPPSTPASVPDSSIGPI